MRRDSEIFLKKLLVYKSKINKDEFTINYKYFEDIPSISTAIFDIMEDLKTNNCLTSQSRVIDLEGNISIYLTLDGITYFDNEISKNSGQNIFNIYSGGLINYANDEAKIESKQNNQMDCIENKEKTFYTEKETNKHELAIIYYEIIEFERYIKYKIDFENIKYPKGDWSKVGLHCPALEKKYIHYINNIYDVVYSYHYAYEVTQKQKDVFRIEDIFGYKNLVEVFFDSSENNVDFTHYRKEYLNLMNKLKTILETN